MRALKTKSEATGNFTELTPKTQELIKELCTQVFEDNCETYTGSQLENIEFTSRSGFIPFDHNRGGITVKGFTDLMSIWGSGTYPAHKGARKEIDRQIDYNFKCLSEHVFEKFQDLAEKHDLKEEDFNYHTIREIAETHPEFKEVQSYIEDSETEFLGCEQSSIMFEIQFMYHGKVNGKHSASLSCAVNCEGPYHRRSISWALNVFCEGASEVEITWNTQKELIQKLKKALAKTAKEVF